jgi:hypothetical protein
MPSDQKFAGNHGGLWFASLTLGIALIVCTVIASRTIVRVKGFGQTITVTGAAYKPIKSDYAIWEGWVNTSATALDAAYAELKRDRNIVEGYLQDKGFTPDTYEVGTVSIMKNYNRDQVMTGYTLRQSFRIELADIDRIADLAKDVSSLIEKGVQLDSYKPRYLFTGLDDLKIDMIRAATENAKLRAEQLAETTGRKVGAPTSARVGVFQIRPLHSQEVSGMGMSDVTSIEKEIVSTVHVSFLIE